MPVEFIRSFIEALKAVDFRYIYYEHVGVVVVIENESRYMVDFESVSDRTETVTRIEHYKEADDITIFYDNEGESITVDILEIGEWDDSITNINGEPVYCYSYSVPMAYEDPQYRAINISEGKYTLTEEIWFTHAHNHYDKYFNILEPKPVNFILPENTNDYSYDCISSNNVYRAGELTIFNGMFVIIPEWKQINEMPYSIQIGKEKFIMLSMADENDKIVYLTGSDHCYKFEPLKKYNADDKKYTFEGCYFDSIYYGGNTFVELMNSGETFEVYIERLPKNIDGGRHTKPAIRSAQTVYAADDANESAKEDASESEND